MSDRFYKWMFAVIGFGVAFIIVELVITLVRFSNDQERANQQAERIKTIAYDLCYPNINVSRFANDSGKVVAVCASDNNQYVTKVQP